MATIYIRTKDPRVTGFDPVTVTGKFSVDIQRTGIAIDDANITTILAQAVKAGVHLEYQSTPFTAPTPTTQSNAAVVSRAFDVANGRG